MPDSKNWSKASDTQLLLDKKYLNLTESPSQNQMGWNMTNKVRELRPEASFCLQVFAGLTLVGTHALSSHVIPDSIGAKNGAIYGTFAVLLGKPIQLLIDRALKPDVPSVCSKVISVAASFFGATASAFGITHAIAKSPNEFSYPDALGLSAAAVGFGLAFLSPCIYCFVKAVRESTEENSVSFTPEEQHQPLSLDPY